MFGQTKKMCYICKLFCEEHNKTQNLKYKQINKI